MSDFTIKRISQATRQDPLTDLKKLTSVARVATRNAKAKAFKNNANITIVKNGFIVQVSPEGRETKIRALGAVNDFPSLADDLCQG